jgi:hypothetical protein
MPVAGEPLPRLYYAHQELTGDFVRADVTLLHQHFSVNLPVPADGKWPTSQRFDFVTRLREARPSEVALAGRPDFPQLTVMKKALDDLAEIRKQEPQLTTVTEKKWGQMTEKERLQRLDAIIKKDPPAQGISQGLTDGPKLEGGITERKAPPEPIRKP